MSSPIPQRPQSKVPDKLPVFSDTTTTTTTITTTNVSKVDDLTASKEVIQRTFQDLQDYKSSTDLPLPLAPSIETKESAGSWGLGFLSNIFYRRGGTTDQPPIKDSKQPESRESLSVDSFVRVEDPERTESSEALSEDNFEMVQSPNAIAIEAEKEADRVENDWRANEKYQHICGQIAQGLKKVLAEGSFSDVEELKLKLCAQPLDMPLTSDGKEMCEYHISQALCALEGSDKLFTERERDAFKEYKTQMRKALATEFYKQSPDKSLHAMLLNKLAFVEFTQVNMQGFTESLAQKSAEVGGFTSIPMQVQESPLFTKEQQQNISSVKQVLNDLVTYHHSIQNRSEYAASIRGEIYTLGLDSTMQGNPVNIKCKMEGHNGKEITNVRTPSPTGQDGNVTPEFKAFLRELKARDESYTMINLQDRRWPGVAKTVFRMVGEYNRSASLEALQRDPEFAEMFTCFTLDKNSPFFKQEERIDVNAKQFIDNFMNNLQDPESGFYIPPQFILDNDRLDVIRKKFEMVHETAFDNKESLTPKQRQDFIEIAYIFLADYYVKETNASYYNESCKDCIDRGGGANWTMMTLLNILEIFDPVRKHESSGDLEERIGNLPADLEADAIWARKRPVIHERLERAHGAIETMINAIERNPNVCKQWSEELNFKNLIFNADKTQATKDPNLVSKKAGASALVTKEREYKGKLQIKDVAPSTGLEIPLELVTKYRRDMGGTKKTDKVSIAKFANTEKIWADAPPLAVPNSNAKWKSYIITPDKEIENATTPTSMRVSSPEENDLANFKLQISDDGHLCITCGVIDTKRKADEFITGVMIAINQREPHDPPIPLRIVLHQLNSQYLESKLTSNQNQMSYYIEKQLREKVSNEDLEKAGFVQFTNCPIVAHINMSLNLTSGAPTSWEDGISHMSNLFGLLAQCIWAVNDFEIWEGRSSQNLENPVHQQIIDTHVRVGALLNIESNSEAGGDGALVQLAKLQNQIRVLKETLDKQSANLEMGRKKKLETIDLGIKQIQDVIENASEEYDRGGMLELQKQMEILKMNKQFLIEPYIDPHMISFYKGCKEELKNLESELKIQESLLQTHTKNIAANFINLSDELSKIEKPTSEEFMMKNKAQVLGLLLSKQSGLYDPNLSMISRNQELELSLILDMMLRSVTEINCKSGLDRTGLARSMWDGLSTLKNQFMKEFSDAGHSLVDVEALSLQKLIEFVINQDSLTEELDYLQQDLASDSYITRTLNGVATTSIFLQSVRERVILTIKEKFPDEKKQSELINALHYQDLICANFLSVAQPITFESTGVVGLKYGHEKSTPGNPHPLDRLPMFVSVNGGKTIQMYTFERGFVPHHEHGIRGIGMKRHYLTEAGIELIERFSQQRGD